MADFSYGVQNEHKSKIVPIARIVYHEKTMQTKALREWLKAVKISR